MNDILLENYIREVLYNEPSYDLNEISLSDFSPKTTLEAGLQAGILSILAIFGNELSKKNELPPEPKAQAEIIMDAVEQEALRNSKIKQILDNSNLQSVEDDLARQLEQKPIEDIYKEISSRDESKIRNWLSDKAAGHEVSYDDYIVTRQDFNQFRQVNDENIRKGRPEISMEEFIKLKQLKISMQEKEENISSITQEILNNEFNSEDDQIGLDSLIYDNSTPGTVLETIDGVERHLNDELMDLNNRIKDLDSNSDLDQDEIRQLKLKRWQIENKKSRVGKASTLLGGIKDGKFEDPHFIRWAQNEPVETIDFLNSFLDDDNQINIKNTQ